MTCAWYNENDPFAAAWLRELIADGLIARSLRRKPKRSSKPTSITTPTDE